MDSKGDQVSSAVRVDAGALNAPREMQQYSLKLPSVSFRISGLISNVTFKSAEQLQVRLHKRHKAKLY